MRKKRKEDDTITKENGGAAQQAVNDVLKRLEMREQRMYEHLDSVVTGLDGELHGTMTTWESKVQNKWEVFEKKWRT